MTSMSQNFRPCLWTDPSSEDERHGIDAWYKTQLTMNSKAVFPNEKTIKFIFKIFLINLLPSAFFIHLHQADYHLAEAVK